MKQVYVCHVNQHLSLLVRKLPGGNTTIITVSGKSFTAMSLKPDLRSPAAPPPRTPMAFRSKQLHGTEASSGMGSGGGCVFAVSHPL